MTPLNDQTLIAFHRHYDLADGKFPGGVLGYYHLELSISDKTRIPVAILRVIIQGFYIHFENIASRHHVFDDKGAVLIAEKPVAGRYFAWFRLHSSRAQVLRLHSPKDVVSRWLHSQTACEIHALSPQDDLGGLAGVSLDELGLTLSCVTRTAWVCFKIAENAHLSSWDC